jgi:hypothetical protein
MKHIVEMSSGVMTYIASLIKIGSIVQKLIRGIYKHTDSKEIAQAYFHFFKIRKAG